MTAVFTFGIHDQFSLAPENKESLTVVQNAAQTLLIDCPSHTLQSIAASSLISKHIQTKVDFVLITHMDVDHIGWLEQLLWWKKFVEGKKLALCTLPQIYEQLKDRFLPSFWQDRSIQEKQPVPLEVYIDFIPINYGQQKNIPGFWSIQAFERSTVHCYGMDVLAGQVFDEEKNPLVSFSADTGFDPELIDFLSKPRWPIIHEAWAYQKWSSSHTHIDDLIGNVREEVQTRMFLNHIPEIQEYSMRDIIKKLGSPLRFADIFYNHI